MSLNKVKRVTGSVQKVGAIVDSKDPLTGLAGATLVGVTVELAVVAAGGTPSWLPAAWVGTPTTTGYAETTSAFTFTASGSFTVLARFNGTEIDQCYTIEVQ